MGEDKITHRQYPGCQAPGQSCAEAVGRKRGRLLRGGRADGRLGQRARLGGGVTEDKCCLQRHRGEAIPMPGDVSGGHACDEAGAEAGRGGRDRDVSHTPRRYLAQGRKASWCSGDHSFLLNTETSAKSVPYVLNSLVSLGCSVFVVSDSLRPSGLQHARPPVHHQLPEFTQTHVHRVSDAIQPSHSLLFPSLPAFHLSQHQGLL